MSIDIVGRALTTWQVDPAGDTFRLNIESADGEPASVVLPAECLNALLMTLPRLLAQALKARYQDDSVKLVYPVGGWTLQAAAGGSQVILTLATPDGFEVSFALNSRDATAMATTLGDPQRRAASLRGTFN